ncbi:ABC transporter ATP-binding protein [Candidatus Woesearchaeota archaeon]|nr:ABC transporter ATP-binding protein [Candidatus Woesearchaeota archaeon]
MGWKDEPVVFLTRKTWKYSEGNRSKIIVYVTLFIIANAIDLLWPLLIAKILNFIQENGVTTQNITTLIWYFSFFLVLTVGFWIFHGPARVIENRNAFLAKANYKKYLLDGTMSLPAEWHTEHHSGDTIDKIEKATTALFQFSSDSFEVIETIVRFIGSYIALVYFNFQASYLVLLMVILTVYVILRFDKILVKQYSELYEAENGISAKVFDTLSNITTVIILRIEKLLSNVIFRKIMLPFKLFLRNNKINEVKWFLVSMFASTMTALVLFTYLYSQAKAGTVIIIGTVYALYGYLYNINTLFYRFAYKYSDIIKQKTAVLNGEKIAREFRNQEKVKTIGPSPRWKNIEIKDLSFSYHTEEGADLHLENISFTIRRGEKIAFIGDSGSGKTTLLKVMRDIYHQKSGNISLDGKELPTGFRYISTMISLIPQEPEIFATTIKENITFGAKYSREEIRKYTDMATCTEVIGQLPRGLQSSLVEKGVNLSGGQKQRLALARGLMASEDKEIILLDEPTSSVDVKNELSIYQNIFKAFKEKTIISSVHRLHLLSLFDTIYYFRNGTIIYSGTFDQLLRESKSFQNLWERYTKTTKEKF